MPSLLTHYRIVKRLYAEEVEGKLRPLPSFLEGNFEALALGAQGPDPLFFYPLSGHFVVALRRYGSLLHDSDGRKFFRLLLKCCYDIDQPRELSRFRSFVLGQFAHYLLDRECHPYVYAQSGFDKNGELTGKFHYEHSAFESQIDVSIAKKAHMEYFLEHPEEVLSQDSFVLEAICRNFHAALLRYFPERKIPKNIYGSSVVWMRRAIRFVNRNPDLKRTLFHFSSLGGLALPKTVEKDVLNERHRSWQDPITGEERTESFLDLFNEAYVLLRECYHLLLERGYSYEVYLNYFDGRNYDGQKKGEIRKFHGPSVL